MKCLQVLLFNTNYSIECYLFVFTLLNGSKYCYVSITNQLNICHLFIQFKCQTVLFDLKMRHYQVLTLEVKVNLAAMAVKMYSKFPKVPRLAPHHQIVECLYPGFSIVGTYPSAEIQLAYSAASVDWTAYFCSYQ